MLSVYLSISIFPVPHDDDDDDAARIPADPHLRSLKQLITPFLDLDIKYYDLGMEYRDQTDDKVTTDAAEAIIKYGVGIKVGGGVTLRPAPLSW